MAASPSPEKPTVSADAFDWPLCYDAEPLLRRHVAAACARNSFIATLAALQPARIARLLEAGLITREQAKIFRRDGAIGSHLENLERRGGFKGFNQKSVNGIIAATDPRKQQNGHPM